MKTNYYLPILLLFCTFLKAQQLIPTKLTDEQVYDYPIKDGLKRYDDQNGNFGYKNKDGNIIIPAQFTETNDFENGFAVVEKDQKFFILKKDGTTKPIDGDYAIGFSEGLALITRNGKSGFMDTEGKTIIPPIYDEAQVFTGKYTGVKKGKHWAIMDKSGNLTTGFDFDRVFSGENDVFTVIKNGNYSFITSKCKVCKTLFEGVFKYAGTLVNGTAMITESDGKSYVINLQGEKIFEVQYRNIAHPTTKYYIVSDEDDKNGVLDNKGKLIFPSQYERFTTDNNGNLLLKKENIWYLLK